MRIPSLPRPGLLLSLAALVTACATPTTKQVELAPDLVNLEKARQRQLALETQSEHQKRLSDLAYPLLTGAVPLCHDDVAPLLGMQYRSVYYWKDEEWRDAARGALGVGDSVQVVDVAAGSPAARAGLEPGDILIDVGDHTVGAGEDALKDLAEWVRDFQESGADHVDVTYLRGGEAHTVSLAGIPPACNYPTLVVTDNTLNAFADGSRIFVTTGMMRFARDKELEVVLAHELAHNAMGHIEAKKKNALLGGILGALADVAVAASGGYPTNYTAEGMQAGAEAFSQDFEREADYVGMYAMALAGYDYTEAPEFWRRMAAANPQTIALATTHPTSAERFIRLEYTAQELDAKEAGGLALRPDLASDSARSYRGPDGESLTFEKGDYRHPTKPPSAFDDDRHACAEHLLEEASTAGGPGERALTPKALHTCLTKEYGWEPTRQAAPAQHSKAGGA